MRKRIEYKNVFKNGFLVIVMSLLVGSIFVPVASSDFVYMRTYSDNKVIDTSLSSVDSWPIVHHDIKHTGYTASVGVIISPSLKWSFDTKSRFFDRTDPVIGNVNSDSKNEIIVAAENGKVYCLNDGPGSTVIKTWEKQLTTPGGGNEKIYGAPSIGNIDGGTDIEILVPGWEGFIYCLSGSTGDIKWITNDIGNCKSSPTFYDVDGDGVIEVLAGSSGARISCFWSNNGTQKWKSPDSSAVGSPAIGNVDGGTDIEIIGIKDDFCYCINGVSGIAKWRYSYGDFIEHSDPVLADVNGDSKMEILFTESSGLVFCLNGNDGSIKWQKQIPEEAQIHSSPAIGDVDNDGMLEVIVATRYGQLFCFNGNTGFEKWHSEYESNTDFFESSPAIIDIDNDGQKEIIVSETKNDEVMCFNGISGQKEWNLEVFSDLIRSPAVGDINNDGKVEIIVESYDGIVICIDKGSNNPPSKPSTPTGPIPNAGFQHHRYSFSSSAIDNDGDKVKLYFDWGDSKTDVSDFVDSGETVTLSHIWRVEGTYTIMVKAKDENGLESSYSDPLYFPVIEDDNDPPEKPQKPSGPTEFKTNVTQTFSTKTWDRNGDDIKNYNWYWGDGKMTEKIGPYKANETCTASHKWDKKGTYYITVEAVDNKSSWSYRSEPFKVTVNTKNKGISKPFINFFQNQHIVYRILQRLLRY